MNQVVLPPTYPKGTLLSPDGTLTSSPGYLFWQQNNAMAAWQDTIIPPRPRIDVQPSIISLGHQVFERAGCPRCHSGPFLTNNRVIPNSEIGGNSARALALQKTETNLADPVLYTFDTPVPLPPQPRQIKVATNALDPQQIDLAWAYHNSGGGYKVPALVGLY